MTFETTVNLFLNQFSSFNMQSQLQDLIKDINKATKIAYFITKKYQERPKVLKEILDVVVIAANHPDKTVFIFVEPGVNKLSERIRKYITQNLRVNCFVDWPSTKAFVADIEFKKSDFEPELVIFDSEETAEAFYLDQNPPVLDELIQKGVKVWIYLEKGPREAVNKKAALPSSYRSVKSFSRSAISSYRLNWAKKLNHLEGKEIENLFLVLKKKERTKREYKKINEKITKQQDLEGALGISSTSSSDGEEQS